MLTSVACALLALWLSSTAVRAAATASPRYNEVQFIRVHNSYHVSPDPKLLGIGQILGWSSPFVEQVVSGAAVTQPSLTTLLSQYRVRALELDFFYDSEGGVFAFRAGNLFIGEPTSTSDPLLLAPGFKVLHLDSIDFRKTCTTLSRCLSQIRAWSDAHPGHLPITIYLEPKMQTLADELEAIGETDVLNAINVAVFANALRNPGEPSKLPRAAPTTPAVVASALGVAVSVLGARNIVTPDRVRGAAASVAAAVRAGRGWPTLDEMRGKFVLVVTGVGASDLLLAAYPNLRGSPAFSKCYYSPTAPVPSPDCAFVDVGLDYQDKVRGLVQLGYVVEGNADKDTVQARAGDKSHLQGLLASGCQMIITDFVRKPTLFPSDYVATLPGGASMRCNPVNAPPGCTIGLANG